MKRIIFILVIIASLIALLLSFHYRNGTTLPIYITLILPFISLPLFEIIKLKKLLLFFHLYAVYLILVSLYIKFLYNHYNVNDINISVNSNTGKLLIGENIIFAGFYLGVVLFLIDIMLLVKGVYKRKIK